MNKLDKLSSLTRKRSQLPDIIIKLKKTGDLLADADMEYRKQLSIEMIRLHQEVGTVWSVCEDIAKGMEPVTTARCKRDKLDYECNCLSKEIKAMMLEMELLEKELHIDYKVRVAG